MWKEKEKPCTIIQLRNETNALEGEGKERKKGELDNVKSKNGTVFVRRKGVGYSSFIDFIKLNINLRP